MTLKYGFVKCTLSSDVRLKATRRRNETQYHLHAQLAVAGSDGPWDVAVNVGTNDADDLLRYRLALDFHHPLTEELSRVDPGAADLTGTEAIPALDFLRSDVLAETGKWRDSDIMDGADDREPYRSLARLLGRAKENGWTTYFFGRFYADGTNGIHDIHMNQGSSGSFVHRGEDDSNDHNDIWQDGAVLVDMGDEGWAMYCTAFTQQSVPTDELGNPEATAHEVTDADPDSEARA